MNILDRFSTHLRETLAKGLRLATELCNPQVEPIHLLFALASQRGSVAAELLNRLKLDLKIAEQAMLNLPTDKKNGLTKKNDNTAQALVANFSPACQQVLEKAMIIACENNHNYLGSEHLLTALLQINDMLITQTLKASGVRIEDLHEQLKTVLANASHFPKLTETAEIVEKIEEQLGNNISQQPIQLENNKKQSKKETALNFFATNLTNPEIQTTIDPVVGREAELDRIIQILCRRTKNNPVLLGDPGVGKTAIVEGLAKKIMSAKVPGILLNKKIYALDMGLLISGAIFRGEFEARLKQIIEEVSQNPNIILFIDEIHNIVGAGSNQGTMDAANILKPALARGFIHCIGATTPNEFKKYIETDPALERRFQPVYVKQSSVEDTIKILNGIKINYENFHNVKITNKAIETAVTLAERYIHNKFLPDKAIDLIDETAAAKKLQIKATTDETKLHSWQQKLEKTITNKRKAALEDKFKEAVELKDEEDKIRSQINELKNKLTKQKKTKTAAIVTDQDVTEQIAKITNISVSDLTFDKRARDFSLEKELKKYIIGQDLVIEKIARLIRRAQLQLSDPNRPLASFLFVGESGVGKTELAKVLATTTYPNQDSLIKLDMSEYSEGFGVSKLLGSPAGYIGYKESNQFTDKVKLNPHCVILFDEIDKAHKDVAKLLLQILENGEITDSTGKKISLKHAIIILTTTIGAEETRKADIGFNKNTMDRDAKSCISANLKEKLKEFFSPELINRLDDICLFNNLLKEDLIKIAQLEIARLNERLKNYQTTVMAEDKIISWLISRFSIKNSNARYVRSQIRQQVENLIAGIILQEKVKSVYQLEITGEELVIK